MASSLRSSHLSPFSLCPQSIATSTARQTRPITVRCGPRDNRGPLQKGRTLSIEAIQAVQSIKRVQRSIPESGGGGGEQRISGTLSRLIKSDLLAVFRELLRQGHCDLALRVFSAIRSETWYKKPDLAIYADLVLALAKKDGMGEDIDRLIAKMEGEVEESGAVDWVWEGGGKGLVRLVKAVFWAERKDAAVRIYRMMKRCGWGKEEEVVDEYLARVLGRGLRGFGEIALAREVDLAYESYSDACLQSRAVRA